MDGDKVVCTPGGKEATMLALDKRTGKVVWKGVTPDGEEAGYSSPVVSTAGGRRQYVTLTSKAVVSFAADTGKLLWQYGHSGERFADNTANIPTVVLTADANRIFATAGYNRGGGLVHLESAGGAIKPHEEYWSERLRNKLGGVVRVGDYLYGDEDASGRLWCAEARTGKVKWTRDDTKEGPGRRPCATPTGCSTSGSTTGTSAWWRRPRRRTAGRARSESRTGGASAGPRRPSSAAGCTSAKRTSSGATT